jgi:type IV pilus assembly protein PilB
MSRKRLGESLLEAGLISAEELNHALTLKTQKFQLEKIGRILVHLNYISEDTLVEFLGKQHNTRGINLLKAVVNEKAVNTIPKTIAEKYQAIPIGFTNDKVKKLVVAMANPTNLETIDTLTFLSGHCIEPVYAREEDIRWAIQYYYYYNNRQVS